MTKVLVTESYLEDIADAIREKLDSSDTYTPGKMAAGIQSIPTGGGATPTSVALNIRGHAFIGSNNTIAWQNTGFPSYQQFWIDLLPYQGKTLTINNTGDRNFYGFTSVEPYNNLALNSARVDSGGTLQITYDGGANRYLIYDFSTIFDGGKITVEVG